MLIDARTLPDGETLTADEFPQIRAQVAGGIAIEEAAGPECDKAGDLPGPAASDAAVAVLPVGSVAAHEPYGALAAVDRSGQVRSLAEVEEEMIRFAIAHYKGQMSQVARKLGIGRSTLYRKLKEYGIDQGENHAGAA